MGSAAKLLRTTVICSIFIFLATLILGFFEGRAVNSVGKIMLEQFQYRTHIERNSIVCKSKTNFCLVLYENNIPFYVFDTKTNILMPAWGLDRSKTTFPVLTDKTMAFTDMFREHNVENDSYENPVLDPMFVLRTTYVYGYLLGSRKSQQVVSSEFLALMSDPEFWPLYEDMFIKYITDMIEDQTRDLISSLRIYDSGAFFSALEIEESKVRNDNEFMASSDIRANAYRAALQTEVKKHIENYSLPANDVIEKIVFEAINTYHLPSSFTPWWLKWWGIVLSPLISISGLMLFTGAVLGIVKKAMEKGYV